MLIVSSPVVDETETRKIEKASTILGTMIVSFTFGFVTAYVDHAIIYDKSTIYTKKIKYKHRVFILFI